MAFTLKDNNVIGEGSLISPSGQMAGAHNYINPYDYAMQYAPDLLGKVHLQRGKGKLMAFTKIMGGYTTFASDEVKHAELGDLHEAHLGVTRADDVFTTTSNHNLRIGEIIMISDGTIERQAVVTALNSDTEFEAKKRNDGDWDLTGEVTVMQFSNIFGKGEGNFTTSRKHKPEIYTNYPHILKEFYDENESDMAHIVWIKAPQYPGGEAWFNLEMAREIDDRYDNFMELTQLLHQRADTGSDSTLAGYEKGVKGIVQQIEERGNIGTETITDIEELSDVAFRIKQQGGSTNYTWWMDHKQSAGFRQMLASVNAHYAGGSNYGYFGNEENSLKLGFKDVYIDGISFFAQTLSVLDEPQLLGSAKLVNTSIESLLIPNGEKSVLENGNNYNRPYMSFRYRAMEGLNRYKKTKFFGGKIGTDHKKDTFEAHIKSEITNQLVGANQMFVFRRGTGIYTGN